MGSVETAIDFTYWDWLPGAATELEGYLERLLGEASIEPHDVTARAKTIASFQKKCDRKNYVDPLREVTDTVAVRVITYSVTDRDRVTELIRDRFDVIEDRNPGLEKDASKRGYDSHHFIVTGEQIPTGWLRADGDLHAYFEKFNGLEVQIRTVAAHAWAEFEHARRYKGASYRAIGEEDVATIDQLFGAAADARRALDEIFAAIDRLLANPAGTAGLRPSPAAEIGALPPAIRTGVDVATLADFLADKYPNAKEATDRGLNFACELVAACGLESIEELDVALSAVDTERVQHLMETDVPVTRVRRLDDDLLALFQETYVEKTGDVGAVRTRRQQLGWRFDRIRNKLSPRG